MREGGEFVKVLVVTSCTGEKKFSPVNQLVQDDFRDEKKLRAREKELKKFVVPAAEMYTGMQHLRLMEGLKLLREGWGHATGDGRLGKDDGTTFDLVIVSAGYGLVDEGRKIVPYEVTFNAMKNPEIDQWAERRGIHKDLEKKIKGYDLVFVLLGEKYLRACRFGDMRQATDDGVGPTFVFLGPARGDKMLPKGAAAMKLGNKDAKAFGYGLVGLKGYLFKLLAQDIVKGPQVLDGRQAMADKLLAMIDAHRKGAKPPQPTLFELPPPDLKPAKIKKGLDIIIPRCDFAANYTPHMKYFIPEWDDRVDPDYDFLNDTSKEGRDTYKDDVYAHEMYPTPNYDGVLFSKIIVEESKKKKASIEKVGCHEFIRFDKNRPVMGDCGAFGYINEENPPYQTEEILNYYQDIGFNIGVSIDHLIVGKYAEDPKERKRRFELTVRNAADFIEKHKKGKYTFLPSGIAQGWDPNSYYKAVAGLVEMGYEHICLGGLVRSTTKDIVEILKKIKPLIPEYLQLHLFGIARPDPLKTFRELGVSAMDSASHLRRAWLGEGQNYYGVDGQKYAAFRIPPVEGHGIRIKQVIEEGRATRKECAKLEREALDSLRKFDKGLIGVDATLKALFAYDEILGDGRDRHRQHYQKLLEDRPWQKCSCPICKAIGIDVCIFRGNNRNRRRGFHNTYVFYKDLKTLYPD